MATRGAEQSEAAFLEVVEKMTQDMEPLSRQDGDDFISRNFL